MFGFAAGAARWAKRHALPAGAATVVLLGAAAGGIGYEIAGHPAAASTSASTAAHAPSTAAAPSGDRAARLLERGIAMLATRVGESPAQVRADLAAGKSINDIAGAHATAIQAEIVTEITKLGDRAVKAGRITAAQEATYLAEAKTRIAALMAEPGPKLLQDYQKLVQSLKNHVRDGSSAGASGLLPPA
jgi:hypothetical protein